MKPAAAKRTRELNTRYLLLKNWYGKERAKVEMAAHSPQPVSVGEVMTELCAGLSDPEIARFIEIESSWEKIVGQGPAAAFAHPAGLNDGVLTLAVRHSALLRELAPSLDLLRSRINARFGETVCREILLVPGGGRTRRHVFSEKSESAT